MKKALKIILNVLAWLIVIFALLITILVFSSTSGNGIANLFGLIPLTVDSQSMSPTFEQGDLIVCKQIDDVTTLQEGDVITFWTIIDGQKVKNTHRIVRINDTGTSRSFSAGVARRRRTRAVLTRRVSTKASLAPLRDFSSVGSDTARTLSLRTSKQTACRAPSKRRAQQPRVRSSATSAALSRSRAAWLYTAPESTRARASAALAARSSRGALVRGRITSSATISPEMRPSSQQIVTAFSGSRPRLTRRLSKSAQAEKIA